MALSIVLFIGSTSLVMSIKAALARNWVAACLMSSIVIIAIELLYII